MSDDRKGESSQVDDIERVAMALYETNCVLGGRELNWGRGGYKTEVAYWRGLARAALAAMSRDSA